MINQIKENFAQQKTLYTELKKHIASVQIDFENTFLNDYKNMHVIRLNIFDDYCFQTSKKTSKLHFEVGYKHEDKFLFGHDFKVEIGDKPVVKTGSMNSDEKSYMYSCYVFGQFCKIAHDEGFNDFLKTKSVMDLKETHSKIEKLISEMYVLENDLKIEVAENLSVKVGDEIEYYADRCIVSKIGRKYYTLNSTEKIFRELRVSKDSLIRSIKQQLIQMAKAEVNER